MGLLDISEVFSYQKNSWDTFTDFCKHIENTYLNKEQTLWFDGEGGLSLRQTAINEELFLFSINKILYASCLLESNGTKIFNGIIEFDSTFIDSSYFKTLSNGYSKKYKIFDASVQIDLKPYDYGQEHKLLFSKADKVDLLFSHHLIYKGDDISLEVKSGQSLKPTIEWQAKVNQINARMEKILADKKAKK